MMRTRRVLWLARILGIAFFTLAHLVAVTAFVTTSLGGLLARGPHGEELGHEYRDSSAGWRTELALEVLSWPIDRPIAMAESQLPGPTVRSSSWRIVKAAGFYGNSLLWGIAIWLLVEGLVRSAFSLLRRRPTQADT
jgi:hypothetical protein